VLRGREGIIETLAFSPNGKWLATSSIDNTGRLWNVQNPEEVKLLKGHENRIETLAFSPDGKWFATGSFDKTARLWNVQNPEEVKILKGHGAAVTTLAFSPDGKWLATGSFDNTARLWSLDKVYELSNKLDYRQLMLLVKFSQLKAKKVLSNGYFNALCNSITDAELKRAINRYLDLQ
jgi:WD40 repeat protein